MGGRVAAFNKKREASRSERLIRGRAAAVAGAILAAVLAMAPALPASAASYINLGPRTCSGSSYLYSSGTANWNTTHKLVLTNGNVAIRGFVNHTASYQTSRYYTGLQGTVNRDGYSFVTLSGVIPAGSNVSSAFASCDY